MFLSKLFGKAESKQIDISPEEAIKRLREVENLLIKKQEFLEKKVNDELEIIKKNGTKNKRISLKALKRKKRLENQLQQIDGTLTTIEFQREAVENANTNTEVFKIMNLAGKALKSTHYNLDPNKIEDLMDEVQEQHQVAKEISMAISNPAVFGQDLDEDELMKELEEIENEELTDKISYNTNLPDVPTTLPKEQIPTSITESSKKKDVDELAELASWVE